VTHFRVIAVDQPAEHGTEQKLIAVPLVLNQVFAMAWSVLKSADQQQMNTACRHDIM